ncbi:unnamed protein product [Lampetra planeri]
MGLWNFSHQILALSTGCGGGRVESRVETFETAVKSGHGLRKVRCPMPTSLGRPVRAASLGACELHYRPGGLAMLVALRCQECIQLEPSRLLLLLLYGGGGGGSGCLWSPPHLLIGWLSLVAPKLQPGASRGGGGRGRPPAEAAGGSGGERAGDGLAASIHGAWVGSCRWF